jgi:hypothetical protein
MGYLPGSVDHPRLEKRRVAHSVITQIDGGCMLGT